MHIKSQLETQNGKDHLGYRRLNSGIILKRVVKKRDMKDWTGIVWLNTGSVRFHNGRLISAE
jgi:hypothetical protein